MLLGGGLRSQSAFLVFTESVYLNVQLSPYLYFSVCLSACFFFFFLFLMILNYLTQFVTNYQLSLYFIDLALVTLVKTKCIPPGYNFFFFFFF